MAEEEPDEPSEGESEESSAENRPDDPEAGESPPPPEPEDENDSTEEEPPDDEDLSAEEIAEQYLQEESGESEEPSPEDLAEDVLEEAPESETEEPTAETPPEGDEPEPSSGSADEPTSPDEESEPPEPTEPESGGEPGEDPDDEPSLEEIADDVLDEGSPPAGEPEGGEEDVDVEDLADDILDEESGVGEPDDEETSFEESGEDPEEPEAEGDEVGEGEGGEPEEPPGEEIPGVAAGDEGDFVSEEPGEEPEPSEPTAEEEPTAEDIADEVLGEESGEPPEETKEEESPEEADEEPAEAEDEPSGEPDDEDVPDTGAEDQPSRDPGEPLEEESPDEEEVTESEEPPPSDGPDDEETTESAPEPPEEEPPAQDDEGGLTEDEPEESSIQDMLEEEAQRTREGEEEEDEEELPEGYMTVEQLPEEEEFQVPEWIKTSGWVLLWLVAVGLIIWYLAMPLWETYLMNQVRDSVRRKNFEEARSWVGTGLMLNGLLIKNDGPFLADYFSHLLENEKFDRFRRDFRELTGAKQSPRVQQIYTEYLLNQGRWRDALRTAETLQSWVRTRGFGYLFHAKASLELGNYELAQSDLNQVSNWIRNHPGVQRIQRDLYYEQGDYDAALEASNQLQVMAESDPWTMKVDDYVRMAQINKALNKRRVAQQMLERALQREPNHKEALKELAHQYILDERWERAEPLVTGSEIRDGYRDLFPFDGFGWWAAAEIEMANERTANSVRYVERAMDLEPRNPEVHRVEGTLYLDSLSSPREAVKSYEEAREFGMRRIPFYNKLAQAYYRSGEYIQAARTYELLKEEIADTQPALNYNIGSAYLGAGQFGRARNYITRSFNQGFVNQKSYNQWGLLLELEGETQEALAKYFEGIEWGRNNNEPVGLVQRNLDRAFSEENPVPLTDWIAPVSSDYEIPNWRTIEDPSIQSTFEAQARRSRAAEDGSDEPNN